jgi:hypothetical protein
MAVARISEVAGGSENTVQEQIYKKKKKYGTSVTVSFVYHNATTCAKNICNFKSDGDNWRINRTTQVIHQFARKFLSVSLSLWSFVHHCMYIITQELI